MNERVREIRLSSAINLSQEAFGRKIGVSGAAISRIEAGQRNITDQMILAICREFHVSYDWLITGRGEMFEKLPEGLVDELVLQYGLDDDDKQIILAYLSLPSEARKSIKEFIRNASLRK